MSSGKLLLFGCDGQLGHDLLTVLSDSHEITAVDIDQCDITKPEQVTALFDRITPRIVINAAAYTDVDGCETNRDLAFAVNGEAPAHIAKECHRHGARLIHYSTDYVFAGTKDSPYTEDDTPEPGTVYGQSKLAGEEAVRRHHDNYCIMRIAWLYGLHGKNFVKTILRLAREQLTHHHGDTEARPLRVVDDQYGNPTWAMEVARQTQILLDNDLTGVVHATAEGETSWYRFAREILAAMGLEVAIEPCTTEEFRRPAPRPSRSSLANRRLTEAGLNRMRPWQEALREFIETNQGEL